MPTVAFTAAVPEGVVVDAEPLQFVASARAGDLLTASGWPYRIEEDADGGVRAVYRFLDHEGVVRARGPRDAILALLATAIPDWRGDGVVALVELWDPTIRAR